MINNFAENAVSFCNFVTLPKKLPGIWVFFCKFTKSDSDFSKIVYHCTTSYIMEHYKMNFVPLTFLEIDI